MGERAKRIQTIRDQLEPCPRCEGAAVEANGDNCRKCKGWGNVWPPQKRTKKAAA